MGKDKPIWRLAFFSRLEERKGIKLFVDAVAALNVSGLPNFEVRSCSLFSALWAPTLHLQSHDTWQADWCCVITWPLVERCSSDFCSISPVQLMQSHLHRCSLWDRMQKSTCVPAHCG